MTAIKTVEVIMPVNIPEELIMPAVMTAIIVCTVLFC